MANLNTRGTLVRTRFDFYESSNVWGCVVAAASTGNLYAYLSNNASASLQLDIYGLQWFSTVPQAWQVMLMPSIQTVTPITPVTIALLNIQPDLPAPVGVIGAASAFTPGGSYLVMKQEGGAQSGSLDLGYGTAHATLPPGWSIVVGAGVTAATELSFTVFYQQILDNVAPSH